jgi:D-lactate dehydrogenase
VVQPVLFFGTAAWEREHLAAKLAAAAPELQPSFLEGILDKDHLPSARDVELCSVFVDSTVDGAVLEALPKLKLVATRSTGFDHIDLAAAARRGVAVASVPSYGENTVAEYAFALLLALSRKACEASRRVREEGRFSFAGLQGFDLKGKTVGVVGTGRIGRHVVRIALGFGMTVLAYDPHPDEALERELGFRYCSLAELLGASDVVTLHVPYLPSTHHLLNAETFALVKTGAYLINTSRGGVVETAALVAALQRGQLAGAGLDVLEEEGVIKDELAFIVRSHPGEHNLRTVLANHVLIGLPNVIVTPHNAFNTREALTRILDATVENIVGFVRGAPVNIVRAP